MAPSAVHPTTAASRDAEPPPVPPRELLDRAWAYDDPASYRAGVQEAISWMARGTVTPAGTHDPRPQDPRPRR